MRGINERIITISHSVKLSAVVLNNFCNAGIVTTAKYTNRGYGVYVIIEHGNGYQTVYGHCSSLAVSYGQQVKKGQLIAYMGSTGNSTGNHLHFEIKSGNTRYDPYRFW